MEFKFESLEIDFATPLAMLHHETPDFIKPLIGMGLHGVLKMHGCHSVTSYLGFSRGSHFIHLNVLRVHLYSDFEIVQKNLIKANVISRIELPMDVLGVRICNFPFSIYSISIYSICFVFISSHYYNRFYNRYK